MKPPDSMLRVVDVKDDDEAIDWQAVAEHRGRLLVDATDALEAAQDEIERLLGEKESVRARVGRIKTKDECPVGTVATIGHPANKTLMVKSDAGWVYVNSGEMIDYDSYHKATWDIYALPMDPSTCPPCSTGDHSNHRAELADCCIGCACEGAS